MKTSYINIINTTRCYDCTVSRVLAASTQQFSYTPESNAALNMT